MSNRTNLTDPCAASGISLSSPLSRDPDRPYVAIGPISNFTAAVTSCCSAYTNNSRVSTYDGGPAGWDCYYYCSFNGTVEDMREVMACQSGAAAQKRRDQGGDGTGYIGIGQHSDLNKKESMGVGMFESPKVGVWRSVVLGLAFFGAMAGAL